MGPVLENVYLEGLSNGHNKIVASKIECFELLHKVK